MTRTGREIGCVAVAAFAVLAVLPALASTIVGTNGADTIRGTSRADSISARAGNDIVYGLAGDDVLSGGLGRDRVDGGAGDDRVLLRDGVRDTAICGPGVDTVVADPADAARADCETVLRPPPLPPPPRAVVIGKYEGRTSQGERVAFQVQADRTVSKLAFPSIALTCEPAGATPVSWSQDFGASVHSIAPDATFAVDESGIGAVQGAPAPYRVVVNGRLTNGVAAGTVALDVKYALATTTYACTAPDVTWTAAAAILNEP